MTRMAKEGSDSTRRHPRVPVTDEHPVGMIERCRATAGAVVGPGAVAAFKRDGYVVVTHMFDRAGIRKLTVAAARIERLGRTLNLPDAKGRPGQLALAPPLGDTDDLRELVSGRLADYARALLSDDVRHLETRVSAKRPGSGEWLWHQEYRHWRERGVPREEVVAAMIHLEPATVRNGCLLVVPRSHMHGLLSHYVQGGQHVIAADEFKRLTRNASPVAVECQPGTVLFFHCNTLHASSANLSSTSRLTMLVTYNAVSNGAIGEPLTVS